MMDALDVSKLESSVKVPYLDRVDTGNSDAALIKKVAFFIYGFRCFRSDSSDM